MALKLQGNVVWDFSRGGLAPKLELTLRSSQGYVLPRVKTLVDTGFVGGLVISSNVVAALGLTVDGNTTTAQLTFPNGDQRSCYAWTIFIRMRDETEFPVEAIQLVAQSDDSDREAILGMAGMASSNLTLWAFAGGSVRIGD